MNFLNIIKVAYIAYTFYALLIIDVTSLKGVDILPAVFVMWFIYIVFIIGYKTNLKRMVRKEINDSEKYNSWILNKRKSVVFFISLISIVSSIGAAYFYTGQSPISVIDGLLDSSRSLYAEYQTHAIRQNISIFSINKIPFILMMFYTKLIFFYISIAFSLIKMKVSGFEKCCILMVTGAHIYFGLARGTNYELFELVILIIFIILSKTKDNTKKSISFKKLLPILIAISIMVFLFYVRITDRGFRFDYTINKDFIFEPRGIISSISNNLAFVIILLYDYFGFGFYYVSNFIVNIWLTSLQNVMAGLIPIGFMLQKDESIQDIIRQHIIMSTRWHPDIIISINTLGFIGVFILLFILGRFTKFVNNQESSSFVYLTQFMIMMQMISFPIGNFVFVSSASSLIVVLLAVVWLWKLTINKRIIFKM